MMRGIQKVAGIQDLLSDPAVLLGGAAGVGAYGVARHFSANTLGESSKAVQLALATYRKAHAAPLMAGAVSALLVGAMVASKVREQERLRGAIEAQALRNQVQQIQGGFSPGEQVPWASPQAANAYR